MSLLTRSINILTRSSPIISFSNIQCRYAGGGGRPGGKPTFNWREKMQLRLNDEKNKKELTIKPKGDFADLKPFFDESRGDVMIKLSDLDSFDEPIESEESKAEKSINNNTRKKIKINMLFGSEKTAGSIPRRASRGKNNFTHSRIFGEKFANIKKENDKVNSY